MTQRDRDRLVVLKKAQKKLITQKQAAAEMQLTERHVRRLLTRLKADGDQAVIHALRGRPSNRKLSEEVRQKAIAILSQPEWHGFGPTLASEWLWKHHQIRIGREALRQMMIECKLWRAKSETAREVHIWRPRRSCRGELVQWDTSEHDWLEGRGPKLYLIAMIDDATGELTARFAEHDSTDDNMRLLRQYLEKNGRPVAFYTDKASLFQTAPKVKRDQQALPREEARIMPPTQITRALQELQIAWIAAHSPQAKGRIERSFSTAQDRLVKGMRLAGVSTLEEANRYLEQEFLPWWNENLVVVPASAADAHRPLGADHDLTSILSHVTSRQIHSGYIVRHDSRFYRILPADIRPGMRGAKVRVEDRLDGSVHMRFAEYWLAIEQVEQPEKAAVVARRTAATPAAPAKPVSAAQRTAAWRKSGQDLYRSGPSVYVAAAANRTRTRDRLD